MRRQCRDGQREKSTNYRFLDIYVRLKIQIYRDIFVSY